MTIKGADHVEIAQTLSAQTGIPEARVPAGYKWTQVGVIPQDWSVKQLEELAQINPESLSESTRPDFAFNYISLEQVDSGRLLDHSEQVFRNAPSRARRVLREGDVLMSTVRPNLMAHLYFHSQITTAVCSTGFAVIRARRGISEPRYLFAHLFGQSLNNQVEKILAGSNYPAINSSDIKLIKLPYPVDLSEQRAIAEVLSDVDGLIKSLEALITKKKAIKQAIMQQLLTGKIRLPGFSGKRTELNMARDSILKARIGWQGLTTAEYLTTGNYYLVTGTDFLNGRVDWSTCHFIDRSRFVQDINIQLAPDDVLLTKDGTIGKAGFIDSLPGPATLNSGVFVIRPKKKSYFPKYMYYILTSHIFSNFLERLQAGSTIVHLYQKDFSNFSFNAPPIDEQVAIVTVLSDLDAEIASLEQRLDKTQAIKLGMMQQLLTGRVRLFKPK